MDRTLGRLAATLAAPAAPKFAQPLIVLPELFTTISHLALLTGYFVSLGWEVGVIDLHAAVAEHPDFAPDFATIVARAGEALAALERPVIALGHGLSGLVALHLGTHPAVTASVALAPALPDFSSPLGGSLRRGPATWLRRRPRAIVPPPGGRTLFEFVADADPFQRDTLIRTLRPAPSNVVRALARGSLPQPAARGKPRLIVNGDADIFAPLARVRGLAAATGAELATLAGRGHWIVGGRALERTVHAVQRFLVKELGRDLLLLYPDDQPPPDDDPPERSSR